VLPEAENRVMLQSLILTHYQCVTDGQTDTPPVVKSHSSIGLIERENAMNTKTTKCAI